MTIQELTAFLKDDVASDKSFSAYFKGDTADKLTQLAAFTDPEQITAQRDAAGLAQYLRIDTAYVQQLFRMDTSAIDYQNTTMTVPEFTAFPTQMMQDPIKD